MTKVDLHYKLVRPLGEDELDAIARVHGVYGIQRVLLNPGSLTGIDVEFDASRLTECEVEAALVRCGIPIERAH
ncbi:MAG: hypothetical protein HY235_17670 [Acidobacteria bacterium]|nr:hypothetical protein [Acidobacteriota bacterium]